MTDFPDIYVLRHGETEWNVLNRFQGRRNSPLTARGKTQAVRQSEILAMMNDLPEDAYVSPQSRALQTAELALGVRWQPKQDDRLQEISFGDWEGLTRQEVKPYITSPYESGLWNFQSPSGEDFDAISNRVRSFLTDLKGPAVIVTHGMTSMVMRGIWLGLDIHQLLKLPREQGCVYHLSNGREVCIT